MKALENIIIYLEDNVGHDVLFLVRNEVSIPYFTKAVEKAMSNVRVSGNSRISPSGAHFYTKLYNGSYITVKSFTYGNTINIDYPDIMYIDALCDNVQISGITFLNLDKRPILLFEFSSAAHKNLYRFNVKGPA